MYEELDKIWYVICNKMENTNNNSNNNNSNTNNNNTNNNNIKQ
jgi:hypothetical protein